MDTKVCKTCKECFPLSGDFFQKSIGYKDGFFSECKICSSKRKKDYVKNNKEKVKQSCRNYESKNRDHRKAYNKEWWNNHGGQNKYNRSYYDRNKEKCLIQRKSERDRHRREAIEKLGGPMCAKCGCNKYELLEINHKNGNGAKETRGVWKTGAVFYRAINLGKRKIDDLEVLCKPCNAIHYLEMKYGQLPYKVVWNENTNNK